MFRHLSRQALQALRHPLGRPLPSPLRGPLQARHIHDEPTPFSGPPSYATLAKRFSPLNPDPIRFFKMKETKEAIERGQFVDIHDICGVDPKDYDALITDVNNDTLHSEISKFVGIPFLEEATKDEADKVARDIHGFVYGEKFRMILPCVLNIEGKARWIFFMVDSGAPLTYISTHVSAHLHRKKHLATNSTLGGRSLRSSRG
jgi:hypothetical protein